ncbi:MAG: DUF1800 domain-containing protein [Acidobacteria bacterium]|nr:DUF1800 domain-containing protein [Acidobacteriota bacterium]
MLRGSDTGRWLRLSTLLCAFCSLLIFGASGARAAAVPEDAPVLISEANSTRALVELSKGGKATLFNGVIQPGRQSVVTFFVTNLDLLAGEGANAFRAEFEDARRIRYPLQVIRFEPASEHKGVYALSVRLNSSIGDIGDVLVRVTWRGMTSNRVRLSIGHQSNIEDDPGATPTPMPVREVNARTPSINRVELPWTGDRVRFMEQATFGPNAALELKLRRLGYTTWLQMQMDERAYSTYTYPEWPLQPTTPSPTCDGVGMPTDQPLTCFRDNYTMYPLQNWFYKEALYNEDQQLRRRVSWALSQILVTSGRRIPQPGQMLPYVRTLDRNAFGNFRRLLEEITLNPAMGTYLDMAISTNSNPNENYAREILQLFSIGVELLNPDGTPVLDGQGNHVPSYNQETINNFTKVFTGWSFCNQTCAGSQAGLVNYIDPMIVDPNLHDTSSKTLLNYPGATPFIPAGQTPAADLTAALDNIFYHPNVPPFISKLLIQQLVTSNPTPAYVGRVSAVFADNGQGQRGDLRAVIRAILLDPEARGNVKTDPDYGKLREPVLFVTNVLRPFNPTANTNIGVPASCGGKSDGVINGITQPLDQDVFNPPTVFNYYSMNYIIPNTPLEGPEFGIFSTGTALKRPNFVNQMAPPNAVGTSGILAVFGTTTSPTNVPCGTMIDVNRLVALSQADSTGALLLDTLNREMMHGAMHPQVRNEFLTAIQAVASTNHLKRARTALYLVATSTQYQVQR